MTRREADRTPPRRSGTPAPILAHRLALPPDARTRLALAGGVLLALGLALAPEAWASTSLRAAAAASAVGGAALLARTGRARTAPASRLTVVARQALTREVGVALLEIDGRPVLVGFGGAGVQLLSERSPVARGAERPAAPAHEGPRP